MASSLLELTANIVSSHASVSEMSGEDLLLELQKVHVALQKLEGEFGEGLERSEAKGPAMTVKKAFQPDQISCMICGKGGMKTLARHLAQVHGMKPGEYRKQFGIPSSQALTAKNFSDAPQDGPGEGAGGQPGQGAGGAGSEVGGQGRTGEEGAQANPAAQAEKGDRLTPPAPAPAGKLKSRPRFGRLFLSGGGRRPIYPFGPRRGAPLLAITPVLRGARPELGTVFLLSLVTSSGSRKR